LADYTTDMRESEFSEGTPPRFYNRSCGTVWHELDTAQKSKLMARKSNFALLIMRSFLS
jgi:hypothetical protein